MLARRRSHNPGTDLVKAVLGSRITGLRRHVFLLDRVNDEHGHGITELMTEAATLAIGVGPNEASIVIAPGPVARDALDPHQWTTVITDEDGRWNRLRGHMIRFVDVYSNGLQDVAFVFRLDGRQRFSIVLDDMNLLLARDLEPFRRAGGGRRQMPRFRERIQ
jgi:hypothetical protein